MSSGAIISECGKYRYVLTRATGSPMRWVKPILFIMLNPSTADASLDDPTIRRCLAFARREGCTRMAVVNLFALRSTDPKNLTLSEDPEGPQNDTYLKEYIEATRRGGGVVVAAWGSHPFAKRRAEYVRAHFGPFKCLGKTKSGAPRHPLYLKSDTVLEDL